MYRLLDLDPEKRNINLFTLSELHVENKSTLLTAECVMSAYQVLKKRPPPLFEMR